MVDFEKTDDEYKINGIEFDDPTLELRRTKIWKRQVTDEFGNYNLDPANKDSPYPRRVPTQIIRNIIKDEDNKEYLTTIETYTGRDVLGNEIDLPVNEPQCYLSPRVRSTREMRDGRYETVKSQDGFKIIRTVPFTRAAAEEAYNRSRKSTVTLLVKEKGRGRKPVAVKDFNEWVERDAYDILDGKPISVESTAAAKAKPNTKKELIAE